MTRDKILDAARELFEEKGFDSTSVREIATKADVNVALINYHFGSKDELFEALILETSAATGLKLNTINQSSDDPETKLRKTIEMLIDKMIDNKKYYQMIHRELSTVQRPELSEKITKILRKNRSELRSIFEEGQAKKVFRKDIDIELTIGTLMGLIQQVMIIGTKFFTKYDDADMKRRLQHHLTDLLESFLKKK